MDDEASRSEGEAKGETEREVWISVKEAAEKLGISTRAVQLRVQQKTLPAKKEGNKLYVTLSVVPESTPLPRLMTKIVREAANEGEAKLEAEREAHIAALESEIGFLRSVIANHAAEIERRDQADAENRRLLLQQTHLLEERLPPLRLAANEAPAEPADRLKKWLQKWRRA